MVSSLMMEKSSGRKPVNTTLFKLIVYPYMSADPDDHVSNGINCYWSRFCFFESLEMLYILIRLVRAVLLWSMAFPSNVASITDVFFPWDSCCSSDIVLSEWASFSMDLLSTSLGMTNRSIRHCPGTFLLGLC